MPDTSSTAQIWELWRLEEDLIHLWELLPVGTVPCGECRRIKDMVYQLMIKHGKDVDSRVSAHPHA
jgi:hypothetical protein